VSEQIPLTLWRSGRWSVEELAQGVLLKSSFKHSENTSPYPVEAVDRYLSTLGARLHRRGIVVSGEHEMSLLVKYSLRLSQYLYGLGVAEHSFADHVSNHSLWTLSKVFDDLKDLIDETPSKVAWRSRVLQKVLTSDEPNVKGALELVRNQRREEPASTAHFPMKWETKVRNHIFSRGCDRLFTTPDEAIKWYREELKKDV
jgi:hypothetical protein